MGSTKHKLVSLGLLPKPSEDPNVKKVVSTKESKVQGYSGATMWSVMAPCDQNSRSNFF